MPRRLLRYYAVNAQLERLSEPCCSFSWRLAKAHSRAALRLVVPMLDKYLDKQGNPYEAPASEVDKEVTSSAEWCEFTRRCAKKIHYRWLLAGFVTWGIYRFVNAVATGIHEDWYEDVLSEVASLVFWFVLGALGMFVVSRVVAIIEFKTSTVAKFVNESSKGKWILDRPLVVAVIAAFLVCVVDCCLELFNELLDGALTWLSLGYRNILVSMLITALVVYPIFRATCRSHYKLLQQMSSRL